MAETTTLDNTKLVPKIFKNISGANYEINYFSFKLPTTIDGFKYNSVSIEDDNHVDYYNKLPYYVNIVDNNDAAITGEIIDDMDNLKPDNMFGVLFYDKPLMVKPVFVFSGPNNMPLYGSGGGYFGMNNMFTAVAYNGIGTTRLYVNDQRVGLFLNRTRYNDSEENNTDNYKNTRVERIAYMPIDTTDPSTLRFNPSYGTNPFVATFGTNDKTYIDTTTKEQVWKYPAYEYGLQTGENEYYDSSDNLVSQPGEGQSRFNEWEMDDETNTAQYIETSSESVSLSVRDDYAEAEDVELNLSYRNNASGLYMYGRNKDAISVRSTTTDEDVTEKHYLFSYVKRPSNSGPDRNYYYPYPTETDSGDVQLEDLHKLMNAEQSVLDGLSSGDGNFMFSLTGTGSRNFDYASCNKLKFFILSVYTVDGHETRTISPVISTEAIHGTKNYYEVVLNNNDYEKGEVKENDYVYLVPRYGYKINDSDSDWGIIDNSIVSYGRRIHNGEWLAPLTYDSLTYRFGVGASGSNECFVYYGGDDGFDIKQDAELMSVAVFSFSGYTFGLKRTSNPSKHQLITNGTVTSFTISIGQGAFNIDGVRYNVIYNSRNDTYTVTNSETSVHQTQSRSNVFVFINVNGITFFVNELSDHERFMVRYNGATTIITKEQVSINQTYGKFDIADLDYLENYDFDFGRVTITAPEDTSGLDPYCPNTYYQFVANEHKTVENSLVKSGRGDNADYKFTAIVVVDQPDDNSQYICNVARAIKVRVSDIFEMGDEDHLYATDAVKTKHLLTTNINAAVYEIPDSDGWTTEAFNNYVASNEGKELITKIYGDLTRTNTSNS